MLLNYTLDHLKYLVIRFNYLSFIKMKYLVCITITKMRSVAAFRVT